MLLAVGSDSDLLQKDEAVAEAKTLADLDGNQSVSALGLRWAALRGMLGSPLIAAEEQRPLREELLTELDALEQDFSGVQARNPMEISAKIDIAKAALQERLQPGQSWLIDLLASIQSDVQAVPARTQPAAAPGAAASASPRPTANLTRSNPPRPDESAAPAAPEAGTSSAA
jgi:hypothetical protein